MQWVYHIVGEDMKTTSKISCRIGESFKEKAKGPS